MDKYAWLVNVCVKKKNQIKQIIKDVIKHKGNGKLVPETF